MKKKLLVLFSFIGILASGCGSTTQYEPEEEAPKISEVYISLPTEEITNFEHTYTEWEVDSEENFIYAYGSCSNGDTFQYTYEYSEDGLLKQLTISDNFELINTYNNKNQLIESVRKSTYNGRTSIDKFEIEYNNNGAESAVRRTYDNQISEWELFYDKEGRVCKAFIDDNLQYEYYYDENENALSEKVESAIDPAKDGYYSTITTSYSTSYYNQHNSTSIFQEEKTLKFSVKDGEGSPRQVTYYTVYGVPFDRGYCDANHSTREWVKH